MHITINVYLSLRDAPIKFLEFGTKKHCLRCDFAIPDAFAMFIKKGQILKYKISFDCSFTQSIESKSQKDELFELESDIDFDHSREKCKYVPDYNIDREDPIIQCIESRSQGHVLAEVEFGDYVDESGEVISIADYLGSFR